MSVATRRSIVKREQILFVMTHENLARLAGNLESNVTSNSASHGKDDCDFQAIPSLWGERGGVVLRCEALYMECGNAVVHFPCPAGRSYHLGLLSRCCGWLYVRIDSANQSGLRLTLSTGYHRVEAAQH